MVPRGFAKNIEATIRKLVSLVLDTLSSQVTSKRALVPPVDWIYGYFRR